MSKERGEDGRQGQRNGENMQGLYIVRNEKMWAANRKPNRLFYFKKTKENLLSKNINKVVHV